MERYFGEPAPKLGFGLMRLPKRADGTIDMEQTKQMVDAFMEAGMTYFDTAYVYDNGASELAARAALVDRYPQRAFYAGDQTECLDGADQDVRRAPDSSFTPDHGADPSRLHRLLSAACDQKRKIVPCMMVSPHLGIHERAEGTGADPTLGILFPRQPPAVG